MSSDHKHTHPMHIHCDALVSILHHLGKVLELCVYCIRFAEHLEHLVSELQVLELYVRSDLMEVFWRDLLHHKADHPFHWNLGRHDAGLNLQYLVFNKYIFALLEHFNLAMWNSPNHKVRVPHVVTGDKRVLPSPLINLFTPLCISVRRIVIWRLSTTIEYSSTGAAATFLRTSTSTVSV